MFYDKRNVDNLKKLAPNTQAQALKWYEYCKKNNANILIYETIRTEAQQREYVNKGASQTMKSYHLVGQALDFVPVDSKGNTLWSHDSYRTAAIQNAIKYAKALGFEWGGDWKSFVDMPHLQYKYKGYGTDKQWDKNNSTPDKGKEVKKLEDFLTKTSVDFKGIELPGVNLHHENKMYVGLTDVIELVNKLNQFEVVWNGELKKVEVK